MLILLGGFAAAQTTAPRCGPDHAILYQKAVKLVDSAEKKLAAKYTAEAKAQLKEANALFAVLVKECGPLQQGRALTEAESQQEQANSKKSAEYRTEAERLTKAAEEKTKQGEQAQAKGQEELAKQYFRQAKADAERGQVLGIQALIADLRTQQMIFRFLSGQATP
ncbi:MAG: hypothetical protein ACUVXF_08470 [Desulfobaccales bacterium]